MPSPAARSSPRLEARIAGALYVLVIVLGAYAELVGRQGLVVDDAAATLRAIAAHQGYYRLGFMAEMITNVLAVPVTLIMWRLLTPAGPLLAPTALVFDLTQNAINAVNAWPQFAPLFLLPGAADLAAIPGGEPAALARLALRSLRHRPHLLRFRPADILQRSYPSGIQLRLAADLSPKIDIPANTFTLKVAETIHFTGGKGNMCPTPR